MKIKQLLFGLLCICTNIFAQEVNYHFEQFTNTYTDLTNPISLSNGELWDDPNYSVPIGFDFKIFNDTITQFLFDEDLGGVVYSPNINKAIVATAADIADRAYNTDDDISLSPISYQVDGIEGTRIFKLEWKNAGFLDDDEGSYFMNVQIWLYENSDMIEIHYGHSNVEDVFYNWEEDFCGIFEFNEEEETAEGYTLNENEDNYEFNYNIIDDFFEPSYFTSIPENGTVFRFYPEYSVGMDEIETVINTYPNPTTDFLNIDNSAQKNITYQIASLDGRIIKKGQSDEAKIQLDLQSLNSGVYLLTGIEGGKRFKKSFVKQ
jgi:hypothetical protein